MAPEVRPEEFITDDRIKSWVTRGDDDRLVRFVVTKSIADDYLRSILVQQAINLGLINIIRSLAENGLHQKILQKAEELYLQQQEVAYGSFAFIGSMMEHSESIGDE